MASFGLRPIKPEYGEPLTNQNRVEHVLATCGSFTMLSTLNSSRLVVIEERAQSGPQRFSP